MHRLITIIAFTVSTVVNAQDSSNTAVCDLAYPLSEDREIASGFNYGIPDPPASSSQIPDSFFTDIGFNQNRAGGGQLPAPCRGWIYGLQEYKCRFQSALSNYNTTRKYSGNFTLLPSDLWGADSANSSTVWPGDKGSFADYDKFSNQLISDMKSSNITAGLTYDIWNEADGSGFGGRPQQQWINLYIRTHKRVRSDSRLNTVHIAGPSHLEPPTHSNTWWTNWLQQIKGNNTIPDAYSWHLKGNLTDPNNDLQTSNGNLESMLSTAGLPQEKQIAINEYGSSAEQVPSAAAWWIARLERFDSIGLRSNYLSGYKRHDLMANLISKPHANDSQYSYSGTGYYPDGEWQVYNYYHTSMSGTRILTRSAAGDRKFDIYCAEGYDFKFRVLAGARLATGTWYITVQNVGAAALPQGQGTLNIKTYAFVDKGHYGEVDGPQDRGTISISYTNDTLTIPVVVGSEDINTAFAFEFPPGEA